MRRVPRVRMAAAAEAHLPAFLPLWNEWRRGSWISQESVLWSWIVSCKKASKEFTFLDTKNLRFFVSKK